MFNNCTNFKKQGDIGLGAAIAWFTKNHYTVCIPLTDSQDYDLVVEKYNLLCRVQVKTCFHKGSSGNYIVNLRVCGGNRSGNSIKKFDSTNIELLFVLVETGDMYLIPTTEFLCVNSLTLSETYSKFKVGTPNV